MVRIDVFSRVYYCLRYMERKSVEHQEHFGRKFYEDKKTGYWISTDYPRIRAHRWVWISVNGPVPKSCHIHHRNENKSDNRIENLQLVSFRQHAFVHMSSEKLDRLRKMAEVGREHAKEWHSSPEGIDWHKYHAKKHKFGKWPEKEYVCDMCSNSYKTTKRSRARFCSNKCKTAWRRKEGVDDETRTCIQCGEAFRCNKYAKNKSCSRKCGSKYKKSYNVIPT